MRMASSLRGALGGSGAPGDCGLESGETRISIPPAERRIQKAGHEPITRIRRDGRWNGLGGAAHAFYKRQQLLPIDGLLG